MAVGAAVVVVLAIVTVVAMKPSGGGRTVTPCLVMSPSGGPDGMYVQVAVPGPVGRDDRVKLTGDNGAQVEVGIRHVEVGFPVPQAARIARVHIARPPGSRTPTAEWDLR
jgi:hypothetical protein